MADTAIAPRTRATVAVWDMRDDESARAYQAFAVYRDMGAGRSLVRLSQEHGKSIATVTLWSTRHAWADRVRAFDAEAGRRAAAKSLNDHAEVRARQAKLGRLLQSKGEERVTALVPLDLAPAEAVKTIIDGAKLERDALGIGPRIELSDADGQPLTIAILKMSIEGL